MNTDDIKKRFPLYLDNDEIILALTKRTKLPLEERIAMIENWIAYHEQSRIELLYTQRKRREDEHESDPVNWQYWAFCKCGICQRHRELGDSDDMGDNPFQEMGNASTE